MNDILLGKIVVNTFIYYQQKNYFFSSITYDQVLATQKYPDIFLDGLGFQYREVLNQDETDLADAMDALARASNGKIPSEKSFQLAIRDKALNPSFFTAAEAVISGTATQIAAGSQAVGNQLIETGKLLTTLLPFIVLGGLFVIGRSWVSKLS